MVWGLYLPRSGGPYGPYGHFEGDNWVNRLRSYYNEDMSDEQKLPFKDAYGGGSHYYPFFVWGKFIHEVGTKDGPDGLPFTPIESHEPPAFLTTEKTYKALSSIISLPGRVWAVDRPAKAVIERLEPGIHQFFPIEVRSRSGKVYHTPYYVIVFGRYLDSLDHERCKDRALDVINRYKESITGRAFCKIKFGNAHLWRDREFGEWMACISDELHDEFVKAGLWIPKQYRMIET